jgi:hypothetical protein
VRFVIIFHINRSSDHTQTAVDLIIWTSLESGCYLIAACLPLCRPLLERIANRPIMQRWKKAIISKLPSNWTKGDIGGDLEGQVREISAESLRLANIKSYRTL